LGFPVLAGIAAFFAYFFSQGLSALGLDWKGRQMKLQAFKEDRMSSRETNTHPQTTQQAGMGIDYAAFAHDLRTPLGGMNAMITLLRQTMLSPEQVRLVDALESAAQHLQNLADHVLTPVSARDGATPLMDMLDSLAVSATARGQVRGVRFRLVTDDAPDIQGQYVEAGALRRVLENLIDNAMRFSPQGEVRLNVEAGAVPNRLIFRVDDCGPGITMEDAARLIQHGGQIAGRAGGAGMGLRLAGALVAERGGALRGGPRKDGALGAEFSFDWPVFTDASITSLTRKEQSTIAAPPEPFLTSSQFPSHLQPLSILPCLVVDDHPAARLILMTILGALGVPCEEAAGIETGWGKVQARRYHAVFTDLNMPEGGGALLLERLATLPADQRPLLIIVSADGGGVPNVAVNAIVQKPISVPAILALVERFGLARTPDSIEE
jgi:signal transduction histidine kinase